MKLGNHRGFAFVEYVTQQEAQNAITALSSTHLYGRHLVSETKLWICVFILGIPYTVPLPRCFRRC
jgi:hypothetical protein